MAGKNIPQTNSEIGKFARCAILSQGSGFGTAACMLSEKLTPEQQIALQCAAQSPDLVTFAACTGGQLTLREFAKCQGKDIAEDECFGENNEIRKFFKNVIARTSIRTQSLGRS